MKKKTTLLLCFLLLGMAFSSISQGEPVPVEVNTDYFEAFQVKGDPAPLLLFFLMVSADKTYYREAPYPRALVRPDIEKPVSGKVGEGMIFQ